MKFTYRLAYYAFGLLVGSLFLIMVLDFTGKKDLIFVIYQIVEY